MSRADWSFLEHLLEEGQEYSSAIGRVWLTVLFLFRMLVLGTAAESAWDDEQASFVCNTKQPGCTAVCYDRAFPISHFRYFVLQVIFVSTPTIFYFGYVAIRARKGSNNEEDSGGSKRGGTVIEKYDSYTTKDNAEEKEKEKGGGKGRKPNKLPAAALKLKGRLLAAYAFSILLKVLLEAGFIVGLWLLYDGFFIEAKYECTMWPCPHTVDCFVSRPTEKTVFTFYTQAIAAFSLLLNLTELIHLIMLAISHRLEKRSSTQDHLPRFEQVLARQETLVLQAEASHAYSAGSHGTLPMQGEADLPSSPCETYIDAAIEVNSGTAKAEGDVLPSYVNCMGAMRKTYSHRSNHKKHPYHNGKNSKGAHKAHTKLKHYV